MYSILLFQKQLILYCFQRMTLLYQFNWFGLSQSFTYHISYSKDIARRFVHFTTNLIHMTFLLER